MRNHLRLSGSPALRLLVRAAVLVGLWWSVVSTALYAQILPNFGEDRVGTAGFQFLKVPVDARTAALGEAAAASSTADVTSLLLNPAMAARAQGTEIGFGLANYYADTRFYYLAGLHRLGGVTLGLSLQAFDAGDMAVTTEFQPFGTGEQFGFQDLAVGVSVAQALTDLFSYGATVRYVYEGTAGITTQTVLLDLGAFYRVGDTGTRIGVAIRHFGLDGTPSGSLEQTTVTGGTETVDDFSRITPPTTFVLGVSYDLLRDRPDHALNVSGQLTKPNDFAERFSLGAEYTWNQLLDLRLGYAFGLEEAALPTAGFGLHVPGLPTDLRIDYGFSNLDRLGTVHRVGLRVAME